MQVFRLINTSGAMVGPLLYSYEEAVRKRAEYGADKRGYWKPYRIQTTETRWTTIPEVEGQSEGSFRAEASRQTASAESNATADAIITAAQQLAGQEPAAVVVTEGCFRYGRLDKEMKDGDFLYADPPAQAVDLSKLERFDMEGVWTSRGAEVCREPSADGDYVYFEDVKALIDSSKAVQS